MKTLMSTFCLVALMSCATAESRWLTVGPGQTRDDVIQAMGSPDAHFQNQDGHETLGWKVDYYTFCRATFVDARMEQKGCESDEQARARDQAAARAMANWNAQNQDNDRRLQQQQQYQQRLNAVPRPTQTSCQTTWMGGTATTNCNSQQFGADTSMYQ